MIATRLYLDRRGVKPGNPAPLKFVVTKNKVRALIPLNIKLNPENWDSGKQKASGSYASLNSLLLQKKVFLETLLFRMESSGDLEGLKACEIKRKLEEGLFGVEEDKNCVSVAPNNFEARFKDFQDTRFAEGTRVLYKRTWIQLERFAQEENFSLSKLTFEDITVKWLRDFDKFLSKTSPARNARNIHFRNIRAVFNDALDEEVITCYPFRRFKLRYDETRKRSLSVDVLRSLLLREEKGSNARYLDCFKLMFFLCGINIVDLCALQRIEEGRIVFYRAKTYKMYSIKVEPEAMEIIEKYRGEKFLLNYCDKNSSYRYFYNRLSMFLRDLGISTYWARHSWATIARKIGVSKDDIKLALGHGAKTVTDIYIDEDRDKIDVANRRVIDYVIHGK